MGDIGWALAPLNITLASIVWAALPRGSVDDFDDSLGRQMLCGVRILLAAFTSASAWMIWALMQ